MSREIKFRAFDKIMKRTHEVLEIDFEEQRARVLYMGHFKNWIALNDIELRQYTGLKDKNGMEIYEGDICRFVINEDWDGRCPIETQTVVVELQNASWGFRHTHPELVHADDQEWRSFWQSEEREMWNIRYFEVIGNIYEHPHLLEAAKEASQ